MERWTQPSVVSLISCGASAGSKLEGAVTQTSPIACGQGVGHCQRCAAQGGDRRAEGAYGSATTRLNTCLGAGGAGAELPSCSDVPRLSPASCESKSTWPECRPVLAERAAGRLRHNTRRVSVKRPEFVHRRFPLSSVSSFAHLCRTHCVLHLRTDNP